MIRQPFERAPGAVYTWMVRVVIALAITVFALWVHLYQFSSVLRWDSNIFVLIGKWIRLGLLPYCDAFETKPPGIFYYLAAVFSILPEAIWSVRIVDLLVYLCGAAAFYSLCRIEVNRPLAVAGTAMWLYFAHHPDFDVGGIYTEEYAAVLAILAVTAATMYQRSGSHAAALCSGLATAGAILFKHPSGTVTAPVLILLAGRARPRALLTFVGALLLPFFIVLGFFWHRNALDPFLQANWWDLFSYARLDKPLKYGDWFARIAKLGQELVKVARAYPLLGGAAVSGLVACTLRPARFRIAVAGWLVADILLVGLEGHYYQHHFIQIFPAAVLAGTLAAGWALQPQPDDRWSVRGLRLALTGALLVLVWPSLRAVYTSRQPTVRRQWHVLLSGPNAWQHDPGNALSQQIGGYIRDRTGPEERVFIFVFDTPVAAYWTSDRLPATRFFFPMPNAPQHDGERNVEVQRTKPAYIVVKSDDRDSLRWSHDLAARWLMQNYTIEAIKDDRFQIWVRNLIEPLNAGSSVELSADPKKGGLVLRQRSAVSSSIGIPERLAARQQGRWTSPVVPVRSDNGTLLIDWNMRSDVARNQTGARFPRAEASAGVDEVDAVLGLPTPADAWRSKGEGTQHITVDIGAPVLTDRVVVEPGGETAKRDAATAQRYEIQVRNPPSTDDTATEFAAVPGQWESADQRLAYHFPLSVITQVRLTVAPDAAGRASVRRIKVPAVGMGIAVRYRTGPTANLENAPWVLIEGPGVQVRDAKIRPLAPPHPLWASPDDADAPVWVPVDRYVQVQCELWSDYAGTSLVLRYVQIGRERFEYVAPSSSAHTNG